MIALKSVRCNACGHPYTLEQLSGASRVITCSNCGTPHELKQKRRIVRRRGTALIDTPRGILLVAGKRRRFLLPGGGALKGETRRDAVNRELREEIGLGVKTSSYLFSYDDPKDGRTWPGCSSAGSKNCPSSGR